MGWQMDKLPIGKPMGKLPIASPQFLVVGLMDILNLEISFAFHARASGNIRQTLANLGVGF